MERIVRKLWSKFPVRVHLRVAGDAIGSGGITEKVSGQSLNPMWGTWDAICVQILQIPIAKKDLRYIL
jgi:hypothetical protein